jgi:hypothetical protein
MEPNIANFVQKFCQSPTLVYSNTKEAKTHHPTTRSRFISMIIRNYTLKPVIHFRPRSWRGICYNFAMKNHPFHIIPAIWLACQICVHAMDPTKVDGIVTVEVDRTERVWAIKITNKSTDKLQYEMMGKVPRGLGLEVWDSESETGWRVHAENLAGSLNIDGFPADIREIAPGATEKFQLNPESMSTTSDLALAKWERAKRIGYYDCRVFFGVYASRLLSVEPRARATTPESNEPNEDTPPWLDAKEDEAGKDAIFGFKLRRMLNKENLSLVSWHRGSGRKGEYYITYTTCRKDDLEQMLPMDENKPMEISLPRLIAKAKTLASEKLKDCVFEGLIIDPCEDDDAKHYASIYFAHDRDDITINLLLNGAITTTSRLSLTQEQYNQLGDFRIPKIREQAGTGQPATSPESKPEGGDKPQPEAEGRSR